MNYLFVIAGVILVIALYFLYLYLTNDTVSSGIQDLSSVATTVSKKLKSPGSTIFSYQFWVFITEPASNAGKNILKRFSDPTTRFNIVLKGTQLVIQNGAIENMVATNNFPIQKWTCVLVNYSESTKILECYINGKLVYTKQLGNSQNVVSSDSLVVGESNFKGYITKVIYLPEVISSDHAWKKYLEGNGQLSISSYFAGYNLNMAISKDDVVQKNWRLFT
jgi:hypothetical protein